MKIVHQKRDPYAFVAVAPKGERRLGAGPLDEETSSGRGSERIFVHTVHDGAEIPAAYVLDADEKQRVDHQALERQFVTMRDWGADRVARHLSASLGNGGYARCCLARVLLDFNRFPGTTPKNADEPLSHLSISEPFGSVLRHREKMALLRLYDEMSDHIEHYVDGALISVGIHTYDPHNKSTTKRPDVSLVATPATYMRESRMPTGVFDPVYPDLLAESTCARALSATA